MNKILPKKKDTYKIVPYGTNQNCSKEIRSTKIWVFIGGIPPQPLSVSVCFRQPTHVNTIDGVKFHKRILVQISLPEKLTVRYLYLTSWVKLNTGIYLKLSPKHKYLHVKKVSFVLYVCTSSRLADDFWTWESRTDVSDLPERMTHVQVEDEPNDVTSVIENPTVG